MFCAFIYIFFNLHSLFHALPILKYFLFLHGCQFRSGFLKKFCVHIFSPSVHLYVCPSRATQLHGELSHEHSRKFHSRVQHPVTAFCPASNHHSSNFRDLTFSHPALLEIQVFLEVTPRQLVDSYQLFGGSYCPHLHGLGLLNPQDKDNTIR